MSRINSLDVARLAGVSRSTVSRVFTPGAEVAAETQLRVRRAADALGYRPNVIARSLTMKSSRLIGVVVGDIANPFYGSMVRTMGQELQARGLAPMLFTARFDELDTILDTVLSYQVDGLIITSSTLNAGMVVQCERAGIPIVLINRKATWGSVRAVSSDNAAGMELIAAHLTECGCKTVAYMAGMAGHPGSDERGEGLVRALNARSLPLCGQAEGHFSIEGATLAARKLLAAHPMPDAIVCANDLMAAATLDVARQSFGLQPGRDIRVTGYDNSPLASLDSYAITSIDQSGDTIARSAVELLTGEVTADTAGMIRIEPRLVARASTTGHSNAAP